MTSPAQPHEEAQSPAMLRQEAERLDSAGSAERERLREYIRVLSVFVGHGSKEADALLSWNQRLDVLFWRQKRAADVARESAARDPEFVDGMNADAAAALDETRQMVQEARALYRDYLPSTLRHLTSLADLQSPKSGAAEEAQRLYLETEGSAESAQAAAKRNQKRAVLAREDTSPLKARWALEAHNDTTRAHDAAQRAALSATRAAMIARNRPDLPDVTTAAIMALEALKEAASALVVSLQAQRAIAEEGSPTE